MESCRIWLDQVKSDLRNYSQYPCEKAEQIASIKDLHRVWDKYDLETISTIKCEKLLHTYLYSAVAPIDVREVNMKTGAASLEDRKSVV